MEKKLSGVAGIRYKMVYGTIPDKTTKLTRVSLRSRKSRIFCQETDYDVTNVTGAGCGSRVDTGRL
jgi:hypothetical protein